MFRRRKRRSTESVPQGVDPNLGLVLPLVLRTLILVSFHFITITLIEFNLQVYDVDSLRS